MENDFETASSIGEQVRTPLPFVSVFKDRRIEDAKISEIYCEEGCYSSYYHYMTQRFEFHLPLMDKYNWEARRFQRTMRSQLKSTPDLELYRSPMSHQRCSNPCMSSLDLAQLALTLAYRYHIKGALQDVERACRITQSCCQLRRATSTNDLAGIWKLLMEGSWRHSFLLVFRTLQNLTDTIVNLLPELRNHFRISCWKDKVVVLSDYCLYVENRYQDCKSQEVLQFEMQNKIMHKLFLTEAAEALQLLCISLEKLVHKYRKSKELNRKQVLEIPGLTQATGVLKSAFALLTGNDCNMPNLLSSFSTPHGNSTSPPRNRPPYPEQNGEEQDRHQQLVSLEHVREEIQNMFLTFDVAMYLLRQERDRIQAEEKEQSHRERDLRGMCKLTSVLVDRLLPWLLFSCSMVLQNAHTVLLRLQASDELHQWAKSQRLLIVNCHAKSLDCSADCTTSMQKMSAKACYVQVNNIHSQLQSNLDYLTSWIGTLDKSIEKRRAKENVPPQSLFQDKGPCKGEQANHQASSHGRKRHPVQAINLVT